LLLLLLLFGRMNSCILWYLTVYWYIKVQSHVAMYICSIWQLLVMANVPT
jgi:hypothetical protein